MSFTKDLLKYKPRKEQKEALEFIDKEYKKNPLNKTFLLNLPVGTGKSHLAFMITDWYRKNVNKASRVDVITNSKLLQDQYSDTYSSICDLKGKDNYECINYSCSCAQGSEFNSLNKTSCDDCPYKSAREDYINGGISLTNFYLYILYALHNPSLLEKRSSNVLIVDEAHEFDDVMSNFISIKITENIIKKYNFPNQKNITKDLKSVKNIEDYVNFLNSFNKEITDSVDEMESALHSTKRNQKTDQRDLKISKLLNNKNSDVKTMNLITDLKQYQMKIDFFLKEYKNNPKNWVLESSYNEKTKQKDYTLSSVWAYDFLDKYVFSNYDMIFLMSGTILNKNIFCKLNGLNSENSVYYSIESPFPIKNRPIYYMPLGKMSYNKKKETFKSYIPYIQKILNKYKKNKGIIHTNSFELSNWIRDNVKDPRLVFHDSSNKDEVLEMHKSSKEPTVIVSPSMDTGVSFDDDFARFQIIAKVPYPSLASQRNKIRQKSDSEWYSWKTVSGIIQMSGRPVRSMSDYADTIILDSSFGDVMRYSSHLMPSWFQDGIKAINVKK